MKLPVSYLAVCLCIFLLARLAGLQEDNKNLKLSLSKVETERKQAQERSNNLEKVHAHNLYYYNGRQSF